MRLLDKMMNKESVILVTGAGGVLGYGILNALEENGYLSLIHI